MSQEGPPPSAAKRKININDDYIVQEAGSRVFRITNPELYVRPEGKMRLLAYAGTAAFVGILGWLWWERHQALRAAAKQPSQRRWD